MKTETKIRWSIVLIVSLTLPNLYGQIASIGKADTLYFNSKFDQARKIYESHLTNGPAKLDAVAYFRLANCYQNSQLYDFALKYYNESLSRAPSPKLKPFLQSRISRTYSLLNKKEIAFAWLDSAVHSGYLGLIEMDSLKDYNNIRKDKRFDGLYKKVYALVYPCALNPKRREFDFWIGEWDVFVTGTQSPKIGHSLIQTVAGECLIMENWTALGAIPNTGKSMNYFDAASGTWEQVWMSSGGGLTRFNNGKYEDGAMRFTFINTLPDGKKVMGKFTFFNLGPDRVRQLKETSADEGKSWQPVYDFMYVRRNM